MTSALTRAFLDTNVYIIGMADPASREAEILRWAGFGQDAPGQVEVVVSAELLDQIARVGRRLRGKDWGSAIINTIWTLKVRAVAIDTQELSMLAASGLAPREDVDMYLAARAGQAQCFVSANHELIRTLADKTQDFECLTPAQFVQKYLH